jgi:acetoin utilization protein AcuB
MLVRGRMSKTPVTTTPGATIPDAMAVMQGSKVHQLPVLDDKGTLVGIVTLTDLLKVTPSPATSLSVWEMDYLLKKLKVESVMTRNLLTVTEDTPVEEAGRIMIDNKIGALPVMRAGRFVGLITESQLFGIIIDVFGARQPGVRVTARQPLAKGGLAELSSTIAGAGGHFVAFAESLGEGLVTFKVRDMDSEQLIHAVGPLMTEIVDVREC